MVFIEHFSRVNYIPNFWVNETVQNQSVSDAFMRQ